MKFATFIGVLVCACCLGWLVGREVHRDRVAAQARKAVRLNLLRSEAAKVPLVPQHVIDREEVDAIKREILGR